MAFQDREKKRRVLTGEGISQGIALGKVFIYTDILTRDLQIYNIKKNDIDDEMGRIHTAMEQVLDDLDEQKKMVHQQSDQFNAAIFDFHKEVLQDKKLNLDIAKELESELINAEIVVKNIFRKLAEKLRSSKNSMVSSKAEDLEDLSRKILRVLVGYESNILEILPPDSIIVARRLLPSDTVHMKRENLRGIVVEEGTAHSHSALLARGLGLTAIANVPNVLREVGNCDLILLDGTNGLVIVNPSKEDISSFKKHEKKEQSFKRGLKKRKPKNVSTKCGQSVKVYANVYSSDDFQIASENGCDGIGLFRLEQLYMSYKSLPNEKDIYERLEKVFKTIADRQITIRLLDVGGDKKLPYLNQKKEQNPFLGMRGVRFLLKHKDILESQVRALIKLSKIVSLRILIPMITLPEEIIEVKKVINKCSQDLSERQKQSFPDIALGAMIETPSSVYLLSEIAAHVDFISVGTNDLIQYIMAADRENVKVRDYYERGNDVVVGIIRDVVREGFKNHLEVNVCGELASDLSRTESLLQAGVRCFSVSPLIVSRLKDKISSVALS